MYHCCFLLHFLSIPTHQDLFFPSTVKVLTFLSLVPSWRWNIFIITQKVPFEVLEGSSYLSHHSSIVLLYVPWHVFLSLSTSVEWSCWKWKSIAPWRGLKVLFFLSRNFGYPGLMNASHVSTYRREVDTYIAFGW